ADVVRAFDERFRLGDEAAHWLALRALTVNAHLLAELVSGTVVDGWAACPRVWGEGRGPGLDGVAFAAADEARPGHLPASGDVPRSGEVTGDWRAARVGVVGGAARLVLLKSVDIPPGVDWAEAARRGWVDQHFPTLIGQRPAMEVFSIRFRDPFSDASEKRP